MSKAFLLQLFCIILLFTVNRQDYWVYPCDKIPGINLPFCDTSLSFKERATDFIVRSNITEAVNMSGHDYAAISRLNTTHYNQWNDAAHGLCEGINWNIFPTHSSTQFPQTIGTGSTLNETLWYLIGDSISTEGRAFWNYNS